MRFNKHTLLRKCSLIFHNYQQTVSCNAKATERWGKGAEVKGQEEETKNKEHNERKQGDDANQTDNRNAATRRPEN